MYVMFSMYVVMCCAIW